MSKLGFRDLICDLCSSRQIRWRYPCPDFKLPNLPNLKGWYSDGDWAACEECAALIEADNWDGLLERSFALMEPGIKAQHVNPDEARASLMLIHQGFRQRRSGSRRAIHQERPPSFQPSYAPGDQPWRAALDGKLAVLRSLGAEPARRSLLAYFMDHRMVQRQPTETARRQMAARHAERMLRDVGDGVRQTEAYYVSPSILERLTGPQSDTQYTALTERPFDHELMPVQHGLLWLGSRASPLINKYGEIRIGDTVRAIFFTQTFRGDPRADGEYDIDRETRTLSAISFIDGRAVDWGGGASLIPIVSGYARQHETLQDVMLDVEQRYDDLADRAMHIFPFSILSGLFGLMSERLVREGRAEVDRATRRRAERERVTTTVQVVEWRKIDYVSKDGHRLVDWSIRWPVKQHLRRLADGRRVTVRSYVKGPEGKPFRAPPERINVIDR